MRKLGVVVVVAAAVALAGLVRGQEKEKTDPMLNKIGAEFTAAFNAKDAAKVASLYTDDAVLMPPNQPMVKGRSNIEAYWKDAFQQGLTNVQLRPMDSAVAGTQAFEAGTATVTVKSGGGAGAPGGGRETSGAVTDTSKYVVVYKRTSTGWRIAYDIFNSDLPAPAPVK